MITEKYKIKERINWLVKSKVNSFSPTISPAPKNKNDNEIESPLKALMYYYDKGIREFIIQKKYMGSYCDIYLKSDITNTYFVSRNGYKVDYIDMEEAIESCRTLHRKFDWDTYETIIIQAEMMPWATLGQTLITNDFHAYAEAYETHYDYLKDSDLYSKIAQVKNGTKYQEYINESEANSQSKIDRHTVRQFKAIETLKLLNISEYSKSIQLYKKQINHYGKQDSIHFKAFNILKKITHNCEEEIVNDNYSYLEINDEECITFTIKNEEELQLQCIQINKWLKSLIDNMEEGIMIKPRIAFQRDIPPCFKIRNNDYLTMIYGVHFLDDYNRYLKKRNIKKKLESSIDQWMLNWELLKINYDEINDDNYFYKNLMYERIIGESKMKSIDHRL